MLLFKRIVLTSCSVLFVSKAMTESGNSKRLAALNKSTVNSLVFNVCSISTKRLILSMNHKSIFVIS